jgi:hypothetical protein
LILDDRRAAAARAAWDGVEHRAASQRRARRSEAAVVLQRAKLWVERTGGGSYSIASRGGKRAAAVIADQVESI